jgi:hypothetical protein
MSITLKRPMFRMGGQAGSEDTGITSGLRQPYQVGRLVTDESNYPYGVQQDPNLMGIGAAANTLNLLNNAASKAAPDSNFFPVTDAEGEVEPVTIEDKINRIMKQYEVTQQDDLSAILGGIGAGFSGAYTLGEALNKAAQTRGQLIEPKLQRAQDIRSKLSLLPVEQAYKEKLQMLKNKDKTFALTDKINKLKESSNRLYEIQDKLNDPKISAEEKKKLLREKVIIQGTIETILPKSDPFLDAFLKTTEGAKMFKPIIEDILKEKGIKPDKEGNMPPLPPSLYPEVVRRSKEYFRNTEGMKKGGRVGMEDGGISSDYTETDTEVVSEESDGGMMDLVAQQTAPAPVQQITQDQIKPLGYDELRSRLPREITNEVVKLLSVSQQALLDFANIVTQKDVVEFNAKYGVNLILPQV